MVMGTNPHFGEDELFESTARRVTSILWEATNGDPSRIPASYSETLYHEYKDGSISALPLISKLSLSEDASFEEYQAAVEHLMKVNPDEWPAFSSITEIPASRLVHEIETDFSEIDEEETDFDNFAEDDMSAKVEEFLSKVIASVYLDGVTSVTDVNGNPPNEENNFLMDEEGNSFKGIFYDAPPNQDAKKFPFVISKKANGSFQIKY